MTLQRMIKSRSSLGFIAASRPRLLPAHHRALRFQSDAALSDATITMKPQRRPITLAERAALRQARREQATRILQQSQLQTKASFLVPRWVWTMAVAVPVGLFAWGYNDDTSPPAQFSQWIGFTAFVQSFTDQVAKPSHDKLLPDWSQVRNYYIYVMLL
jgi:hypothetical protein